MTVEASAGERRRVDALAPYARNSRTHSAAQIDQIAASITEFGWTTPPLIDENDGIIAGHGRIMAAQQLGIEDVPVIVARGWSEAQKRAYILADNKIAIEAGWDEALLKAEFEALTDLDFDLSLTGFGTVEIGEILGDGVPISNEADGETAGASGDFLKFGRQRIPLTPDEAASLDSLISRYVEVYGVAHGFVRWIVEGNHLG